jgi:Domain of unknown function (DUF4386)
MTRTQNARLAGFLFLFYIAIGVAAMVLFEQATAGADTAAKLASIVQHEARLRLSTTLSLITIPVALLLAVSLWAITREADRDVAAMALACRIAEGAINAIPVIALMALISVAKRADVAVGAVLLNVQGWTVTVGATIFAVGSTFYSYLFLKARNIPTWLAWLGLISSALLTVSLPLQVAGLAKGPATWIVWIPIALFEVILGFWLLIKGVRE